ncbi:MAG: tRNA (N6-threonylcarbamoyladenosine(37)-N6)-methyltransferase TrmO [Clostridia bacterium]|nr:tRNA (N6-threonylcarbamoyladenosine(37)-N6)-methyltransferase TrmO [Clostridia bacterium]
MRRFKVVFDLVIEPIAYIHTDFSEKFGIPRQSGRVPALQGRIVFEPSFRNPDTLRDLDGFSRIWLIFGFSKASRDTWSATVRPPRLGGNRRVGVFASRSPYRPNPLGLSCVQLDRIEQIDNGPQLIVSGVDLLDNTPIYDIKPYIPYADCYPDASAGYTQDTSRYCLTVDVPQELLARLPQEKREAVVCCLAEDPRPSYQDDPDRIYSMRFMDFDVRFRVQNGTLTVIAVDDYNTSS